MANLSMHRDSSIYKGIHLEDLNPGDLYTINQTEIFHFSLTDDFKTKFQLTQDNIIMFISIHEEKNNISKLEFLAGNNKCYINYFVFDFIVLTDVVKRIFPNAEK